MNNINLIGSVGKDLVSISDNTSAFSICVNKQKKNETGEYETVNTTWFNCNISGKSLQEYKHLIKKGAIIGITGENTYNESKGKIYHNVQVYQVLDKSQINDFRKQYNELVKSFKSTSNETINNNVTGYEEPPISQRDLDDEVPF